MQPIIAAYNFCNPQFTDFLDGAAEAGYTRVGVGFYKGYFDVLLETLSDEEEAQFRQALDSRGLSLVAIFSGANLLADDGLEVMVRKIDNAARLGVNVLDTGAVSLDEDAQTRRRNVALFEERIRRAGDHAAKVGLTICLETHGGYTGHADACLEAMAAINHEHVRLAYDPANFLYYEGRRPEERLAELLPFIGHTHLKDHRGGKGNNDFPAVGEGEVGYETLLPAVWAGGYRGAYTLERAVGETSADKTVAMRLAREYMERLLA